VSASRRGRICICGGGKGGRPLQLFEEILVHAFFFEVDLGACCAKKEERKGDKSCCSTSLGSNKVISMILVQAYIY